MTCSWSRSGAISSRSSAMHSASDGVLPPRARRSVSGWRRRDSE
ncbi:Uncharacterised protein [Bordetella pertussis]|nr:Uncharacterised protein [Bordetella pertussis]